MHYDSLDQLIFAMRTFAHRESWTGASTAPADGNVEVAIDRHGDDFGIAAYFVGEGPNHYANKEPVAADKMEAAVDELVAYVRNAPLRLVQTKAARAAAEWIDYEAAKAERDDAIRAAIAHYDSIGDKRAKTTIAKAAGISRERLYQIL